MNAVSATVQALRGASAITTIVGQRIEPFSYPPKQILPGIVVTQMVNMDERLLAGQGQYPVAVVTVDCLCRTATEALTLGDAVITRLRDLSGSFGGVTVTSFLQEESDETTSSEDYQTYRRSIDFSVRYRAA